MKPLQKAIAESVLRTGLFGPDKDMHENWVRHLEDEASTVIATFDNDALNFRLSPAVHSQPGHANVRLAASVMFEMSWRYAEKVHGEVFQVARVAGCKDDDANTVARIAHFPLEQFVWDSICPGFKAVILGEGDPAHELP